MSDSPDQLDLFAELERRLAVRHEATVRAAVASLEAKLEAVLQQLGPIHEQRVGDADVARALGYSVEGWRNFVRARLDRPAELPPHVVLSGRRLYRMREVERWLGDHPEVRGRRRRPGGG